MGYKDEFKWNEKELRRSGRVNSYRSIKFEIWTNSIPKFNIDFLGEYYRQSKTAWANEN